MNDSGDSKRAEELNLGHYAQNVECSLCRSWIPKEQALPLNSLSSHEQGLVNLNGFMTEHENWLCKNCLEQMREGQGDVNSYLNAFAHLESYHELIQGVGRAFLGVILVGNLFVTQNIAILELSALFFALCDWPKLASIAWTILKFPPLFIAILFIPWTVTVFLGTQPFVFAKLIEDPLYYCPWKTFTFINETYVEAVFLGLFILGILYVFAIFGAKYLDEDEISEDF